LHFLGMAARGDTTLLLSFNFVVPRYAPPDKDEAQVMLKLVRQAVMIVRHAEPCAGHLRLSFSRHGGE
jgi:hypothetical protein